MQKLLHLRNLQDMIFDNSNFPHIQDIIFPEQQEERRLRRRDKESEEYSPTPLSRSLNHLEFYTARNWGREAKKSPVVELGYKPEFKEKYNGEGGAYALESFILKALKHMEMYNLLADDDRLEQTRIDVITSRLSGAAATWHVQFTGRWTYTTLKSLIEGIEK